MNTEGLFRPIPRHGGDLQLPAADFGQSAGLVKQLGASGDGQFSIFSLRDVLNQAGAAARCFSVLAKMNPANHMNPAHIARPVNDAKRDFKRLTGFNRRLARLLTNVTVSEMNAL